MKLSEIYNSHKPVTFEEAQGNWGDGQINTPVYNKFGLNKINAMNTGKISDMMMRKTYTSF